MKRNGRECKELKEIKGDERKWKEMKRKFKKKGNDGKGQKMEGNRRNWKTNERK